LYNIAIIFPIYTVLRRSLLEFIIYSFGGEL